MLVRCRRTVLAALIASILTLLLFSWTFRSPTTALSPGAANGESGADRVFGPPLPQSGDNKKTYPQPKACGEQPLKLHVSDAPHDNYFYADCHSSSQVVVTTPSAGDDLSTITPRLLIAWPAGNAGAVAYFAPRNGVNGSLAIDIERSRDSLEPIFKPSEFGYPEVGVSGRISFNDSAILSLIILGSIRSIRDFVEGHSLDQKIQSAHRFLPYASGTVSLLRTWLDGVTTTKLSFTPAEDSRGKVVLDGPMLYFEPGTYIFNASYNYPQLDRLGTKKVIRPERYDLLDQFPDQTLSLSFLSYTTKLVAGAWRFLTYFGRDSMISLLLMQPILSEGKDGAIEAAISAVLERINNADGSVAHEEVIGDYARFLNQRDGIDADTPRLDYKMVDTDFFLPIVVKNYFLDTPVGRARSKSFFSQKATLISDNRNITYADLLLANVIKILNVASPFARVQKKENLIHLQRGQLVGNWRDSEAGLGGGRVPYDVNTALVPAALRAIEALSAAAYFPEYPDWKISANWYAKVWEDETLPFFEVKVPVKDARDLILNWVTQTSFRGDPSIGNITSHEQVYYGVALDADGKDDKVPVKVMNSDDCFRLFLVNATHRTDVSWFLSQAADHVLQPFPVGLSTPVGFVVANPAYGDKDIYSKFDSNAYHGTVVWSWQLAMMAAGFERQLDRCTVHDQRLDFCNDQALYDKIKAAYNHIWDTIEKNSAQLASEVWSWTYDEQFKVAKLGGQNPVEADVRQLWSLAWLAIKRNESLR